MIGPYAYQLTQLYAWVEFHCLQKNCKYLLGLLNPLNIIKMVIHSDNSVNFEMQHLPAHKRQRNQIQVHALFLALTLCKRGL